MLDTEEVGVGRGENVGPEEDFRQQAEKLSFLRLSKAHVLALRLASAQVGLELARLQPYVLACFGRRPSDTNGGGRTSTARSHGR